MATSETNSSPARAAGAQTLARGLRALELIAQTPGGMTIQDVAVELGVHRSIATRLLSTVAEFRLINRGPDGRYRAAGGLAALAREVYAGLRDQATPPMRQLANTLGASVALFVAEAEDAVAVAVVEPADAPLRVAFRQGGRHPLDRGAAGYALLAAQPERPGENPRVTEARQRGYVISFGEVAPGFWGLGVPLTRPVNEQAACLTLISASRELVESAPDSLLKVATELSSYAI
ncbi:helix-turn-helix domain-containing protein [Rhodococcus sp. NPDC057014]|uniref:IclR family transcriptional regulator domain-containing protein n=1 Tax=Rhodococcus sp. NPDC057014 TaxID=3346000 RepID=UPI00362CDD3B